MRHTTILVAVLAFVPLASAPAQEVPALERGARVRVRLTGVHRCGPNRLCAARDAAGLFVALERDSLILDRLAIPTTSITRFEVFRGRGPAKIAQAIPGLFLGAALGALTEVVSGFKPGNTVIECKRPTRGSVQCQSMKEADKWGSPSWKGLGAGAVLGAVLGWVHEIDRWEQVSLMGGVGVGFTPQQDGSFALAASIKF